MKKLCPFCGHTDEHKDFCPDSPKSRNETVGLPAYMRKMERVQKDG
jgi:hypothetical protein